MLKNKPLWLAVLSAAFLTCAATPGSTLSGAAGCWACVPEGMQVKSIAATTTRTGLKVRSALDTSVYPKGVAVPDAEMQTLYLKPEAFHGEWNYALLPRQRLPGTD